MKLALLVGATVLAVAAVACGDDSPRTALEQSPTPGREATQVSPPFVLPTPTATPMSTILPPRPTSGWAVFRRAEGGALWIGRLDGSEVRTLTDGAFTSGYAGWAIDTRGERWVYFAELTEQIGENSQVTGGTVEILRQRLDGDDAVKLVASIELLAQQVERFGFHRTSIAVAPDDRHVAYADENGLGVLTTATGIRRILLANKFCKFGDDISTCKAYSELSWSFDGAWMAATETHYEGGVAVLLQPSTTLERGPSRNGPGGLWARWSLNSLQMCASEQGYGGGGGGLLYTDGTFRNLGLELQQAGSIPDSKGILGCVWRSDGGVALDYWHDFKADDRRVLILNSAFDVERAVRNPWPLYSLVAWLPDASGFVVTQSDGIGRGQSRILLLNGSVHALAIDAYEVIAVIPD